MNISSLSLSTGPCAVCHDFRKRSLRFGDQIRFAADFCPGPLLLSALKCPLCAIVLKAIQQFALSKYEVLHLSVVWIYIRGPAELPPRTLSLEIYFKDSRPKLELEIYAQDYKGSYATSGVIIYADNEFQPKEPLSNESISWVQSHIADCLGSHNKCSNATETLLPSRVLSLRKSANGSILVSLRETSNTTGIYACLSHRWGGNESGRTTRSSYASMLEGIVWESIPRTFQDAMQFAMSLGIENIWIDSFCIIQDDTLDWQEQAAQMANIYQNSYITLAATASSNSDSGSFWDSDASYEKTFSVERGDFVVRKTMKHWDMLWTSAAAFPLLSRAWVFQERLLAPRVLHFSHHELVWECRELGECQCGGYHALSNPKARNWISSDSWASAVELFTSLYLTVEQDRLPAFFGFASFYAKSVGASIQTDYFAGLWRESLHQDMLWRIDSSAHKLGSQGNRLCCCFDGTYSSDINWRCQHSYSAACSLACLEDRHLCRYGKPDAAVPYTLEFLGSCSGKNKLTTIRQLQQRDLSKAYLQEYEKEPYLGPSWSWVSARTRVQYLKDLRRGSQRDGCVFGSVQVNYSERHLIGPITSATLTVSGHVTRALLQYEYLPDPVDRHIKHHNIFSYGLEIRKNQRRLDFDPDYVLSLEGEKWLPPGTPVFVLHVASGAHLVLKEKIFFKFGREARSVNRVSSSEGSQFGLMDTREKYVRIGIFRIPENTTVRDEKTYWQTGIQIV